MYKYSNDNFLATVKRVAKSAGTAVLETAFTLYYALQDTDTPSWAKSTIVGALAYFISPIDAVPDILPVLGYMDDAAVLAGACIAIAAHIKGEHKIKAAEQVSRIFGA
jgi:uncharacterized membrane protein YkvA (DUF1232 family)